MSVKSNFIAGRIEGGPNTITSDAGRFSTGSPQLIDQAVEAAADALSVFSDTSRALRAAFLDDIAECIEAAGDELIAVAMAETNLPEARLIGERGRTCAQLRLFASHIRDGAYLDRRHDEALPERTPLPRPELKMIQRPVGPVGVFGASNFPLAFSVAGGDTASALAAGCPVVVKGHPAHPGTSAIVAKAITDAVVAFDLPGGVFSMVQDGGIEVGTRLVTHPKLAAVGFTGSHKGGRALFDLCAARPVPIPFFGELGAVNPVFILPNALEARGAQIGAGWAASLTMGAGQFCTNPGVVVAIEGEGMDAFRAQAQEKFAQEAPHKMLTDGIADAFDKGAQHLGGQSDVAPLFTRDANEHGAGGTYVYEVTGETWLANTALAEEVFGPFGILVRVKDATEMLDVARSLDGQLTVTLQMDAQDVPIGMRLMPHLEQKAGRILANGFPTGVEVADAMVHGGPYPASTNFGATSVGTMAIRRWLRPVCYQNMPEELLPSDLR